MSFHNIREFDNSLGVRSIVKIKNKTEIMLNENISKKVRNYFVFPSHIGLIFTWFQDYFYNSLNRNYGESDSSVVFVGFSWAKGGATKLYNQMLNPNKWNVTSYKHKVNFYTYSDDCTLTYMVNGKPFVIAYDLKHHDLSLKSYWMQIVLTIYNNCMLIGETGYNDFVKYVMTYNVYKAFSNKVLFQDDLLVETYGLLHSGIPGTSMIGTFAALYGFVIFMDKIESIDELTPEIVALELDQAYNSVGITIKKETLGSYSLEHHYDYIQILGQRIVKYDRVYGLYLPKPEKQNLINSLLKPTKTVRGMSNYGQQVYAMVRALGVCVSGGYMYDDVYELCAMIWLNNYSDGIINEQDLDMISQEGYSKVDWFEDRKFRLILLKKDFPTKEFFLNIYLPEDMSIPYFKNLLYPIEIIYNNPIEVEQKLEEFENSFRQQSWADIQDEEEDILKKQGIIPLPMHDEKKPQEESPNTINTIVNTQSVKLVKQVTIHRRANKLPKIVEQQVPIQASPNIHKSKSKAYRTLHFGDDAYAYEYDYDDVDEEGIEVQNLGRRR
jgi:hypothetical protein